MFYLKCSGAGFSYDGVPVLRNVNFEVYPGDYLCIVGENGSGKSTLIKGLLGLKQPDMGKIEFGDNVRADEIGYLPQKTDIQRDFPASVQEVVLSGRLNSLGRRHFYSADDKRYADNNLQLMGIEKLKNRSFHELSGGQQQRVLLARALCAAEKMLLLDEPVAGLDPVAMAELYSLIKKINEELGMAIIMVSHDIHAAVEYADHILHLGHDQTFWGSTDEYKKSEMYLRFTGGDSNA